VQKEREMKKKDAERKKRERGEKEGNGDPPIPQQKSWYDPNRLTVG